MGQIREPIKKSSIEKKNKIIETEHGFSTLNTMLKIWINNKKDVILVEKSKKI